MREIVGGLAAWQAAGVPFALVTVVRTWKSAPRQPGAAMAVSVDGEVLGSVSGGCVEGAVYEVALEVLRTGVAQLVRYGVSDGDAFDVGLTCGGTVELFVQPIDDRHFKDFGDLLDAIAAHRPVAMACVVSGPSHIGDHVLVWPDGATGTLGALGLDAGAVGPARGMLGAGTTGVLQLGENGEQLFDDLAVFVQSFTPAPRMIVFGAVDFAGAVARIGKFLGFHVTVCDARPVFATAKRFPEVDELVVAWPHRYLADTAVDDRTVICVLTHDPKFDIPVLEMALAGPARYVGAMGSRRTHDDRMRRLRARGVPEEILGRLSSPIGLDLGARTPEETAIAIAAEIVATNWAGTTRRLSRIDGPIHRG